MTPITCPVCKAVCETPNEAKRFLRRHPNKCKPRIDFTKQLAQDTKCVEDDFARSIYARQGEEFE